MKKYTLTVEYNAAGFKRYTISLAKRNKGVVLEIHGNSLKVLFAEVADWIAEN